VPKLPTARLDPEVVFLVFVPPLVYRAALTTSWRDSAIICDRLCCSRLGSFS